MGTYSFQDVKASIAGPGGAFALGAGAGVDKEGITVTPTQDVNLMSIGADGSGMHSLHADKSGRVTVRLLKTSPVNNLLAALYAVQTSSGALHGKNTIVINNMATGDVITCAETAFRKAPDLSYAENGGMNVWEFDAVRVDRLLGAL